MKDINNDDEQVKTPEHDALCFWVDTNIEKILRTHQGINNGIKFKLHWEVPIKGYNGFLLGFPDFSYYFFNDGEYKFTSVDTRVMFDFGFIEVKPTIASVGATMRQLQNYKTFERHLRKDTWANSSSSRFKVFLVTYDTRYKDIFEKQGFPCVVVPKPPKKDELDLDLDGL